MEGLLNHAERFVKRNSATILTCVGGVGVVSTAVLAAKAAPKATKLLEEAKQEKKEELSKWEIVRVAGPVYAPTIVTGMATLACIFGANVLNKRNQAALMSAYALVDTKYKEYRNKVKELYGEETDQEVINAIAVEKAGDVYVSAECLCENCDLSVEDNDGEPKLFYDEHSNRYFEATIERVIQAEYHLNRNFTLRGHVYLNEFYEFLGLPQTDFGEEMGWSCSDGYSWIDFEHTLITKDDGGPDIYAINAIFPPDTEYLREWE